MARSTRQKFYAVKIGRNGPQIYTSWDETKAAVDGYPGARHRSFDTMQAAQDWLDTPEPTRVNPFSQRNPITASTSSSRNQYRLSSQPYPVPNQPSFTIPPRGVVSQPPPRPRPKTPPNTGLNSRTIGLENSGPEVDRTGSSAATAIVIPDTPSPRKPSSVPIVSAANTRGIQLESRSLFARPEPDPSSLHRSPQPQPPPAIPEPQPDAGIIELSEEQQRILDKVKDGQSLFFTGSAGTGKSVLLRAIIAALQKMHGGHTIAVTAPTGIASVNIGGQTIHSFSGIGLGKEAVDVLLGKISRNKAASKRWKMVKTLIIDEISMVDGNLFDKLERIARAVRGDEKPFGGIQLVISGDFFQLPPVPERNGNVSIPAVYCFDALSWERCVPRCYTLTRVFRQKDQRFVDMLNKMRVGELEHSAIEQFKRLKRPLWYDDEIQPTQLFPLKSQVERANSERLNQLPGPTYIYQSTDTPGMKAIYDGSGSDKPKIQRYEMLTPEETEKSLERLIALKELALRKDAQVMLIQNMRQGRLVNGSLGKVVGFKTVDEAYMDDVEIAKVDQRKSTNGRGVADGVGIKEHDSNTFVQAPSGTQSNLRQARLHSSRFQAQHDMLSEEDCTCGADFEGGECSCGITSTQESSTGPTAQDVSEQVLASLAQEDQRWPVVQFTTGETIVMPPVEFSVVNAMGIMEAKRVQVPLVLSYALSIHKSQGQTLQRVKIDLGGTFEMGQAYVALSRATSLQTLQVLNFNQYKVMADRRVIEWSKTLRVHRPGEDSEPEEAGEMSEDEEEDEDEDEEQYVEEYEEEEGEDEFFGTAPELNRDSQTVIEISDDEDDAMEICSESGETQEEDDF